VTTRRKLAISCYASIAALSVVNVVIRVANGYPRLPTAIAVLVAIAASWLAWASWKDRQS
jgi:hypothetical protein